MEKYLIDKNLAQAILDYLVNQPYKDVYLMIQGLQQLQSAKTQEAVENPQTEQAE